jgi:hypothetical protein
VTGKKSRVAVAFVRNVNTGIVQNLEIVQGSATMLNCKVYTTFPCQMCKKYKKLLGPHQNFKRAFANDRRMSAYPHRPNGDVCLNTLDKVLTFLKVELKHAGPSEVFKLEFDSKNPGALKCSLNKIEPSLVKRGVLPNWYTSWLASK